METCLAPSLAARDHAAVWHPFTQMKTAPLPIAIERARGTYLYAENGTRYIDGIASWWTNLHGHAHPYIAQKIAIQAQTLEHVHFAGFTHSGAVELAERLLEIAPGDMAKAFYSDNGSTAVETALKMALQYWYNLTGKQEKRTIIAFKNGYHGDTFGAMSAAGKHYFTRPFWPYLFDVELIDAPCYGQEVASLQQLEAVIAKGNVGCFLFEPLVQGAAGMVMHTPEALSSLIELCKKHGVITIADEVMTGFGRTGPLFACELLTKTPDIICLSKGLTGGFLPLGATLCKQHIYDAFLSEDKSKALLHGHSYSANPLACAAALASMDLLLRPECTQQREMIHKAHQRFCREMRPHPGLKRCETRGTILACEYQTEEGSSYFHALEKYLNTHFLAGGVALRPLGNTVYILPPYCINEENLNTIYDLIKKSL